VDSGKATAARLFWWRGSDFGEAAIDLKGSTGPIPSI